MHSNYIKSLKMGFCEEQNEKTIWNQIKIWTLTSLIAKESGGRGGTRLSFGRPVPLVGGGGGGWKPDPVSNRSAQKYTLSQYTLLKTKKLCRDMHTLWTDSMLLCIIIHS